MNANGVALAAIQSLNKQVDDLKGQSGRGYRGVETTTRSLGKNISRSGIKFKGTPR